MDPTMTDGLTSIANPELGSVLLEKAMKGTWGEVVDICMENPWALVAGITRFEDTLLHLAVSDGQEETVRKFIRIIYEQPNREMVLRVKNDRGNTALHLAAMVGNVTMCKRIASIDSLLIGERNNEGETPLFTAVLFDKIQAFQCLYNLCPSVDERYSYSWNTKTGDTILHYAISGDHFDLALRIIESSGEVLVKAVNENRITPLHLLADKPSAFASGSRLGVFERIIYQCIYVDEHMKAVVEVKPDDHSFEINPNNYPENYRTCNDFYRLFWNFFTFLRVVMGINVGVQIDAENPQTHAGNQETKATSAEAWNHRFFPANYEVCCNFLKLANRIVLIVLGGGIPTIKKIYEEKRQHALSIQIMNKLLQGVRDQMSEYYYAGKKPSQPSDIGKDTPRKDDLQEINPFYEIGAHDSEAENREGVGGISGRTGRKHDASSQQTNSTGGINEDENPILIAARNGISEIVEKILELCPIAIKAVDKDNKNVMLLAVQYRQPHVFQILLKKNIMIRDRVLRVEDKSGNNAAHLAAVLGAYRPWLIPGEALQMQWEMKWFELVTQSIPRNLLTRRNNDGKTPEEIFIESHEKLVKEGGQWLIKTSESYSLVAALIATVAFASSTAVPGGVKQDNGIPTLANRAPFHLFAISSLIALCFSVTALVTFLSILTSRNKERDFGKDLPMKLLIGLTSLFFSIAAVLVTFCSGHFFVIEDKLKYVAYPVYAATCLPVTFFAVMQFPLYFDLIGSTFKRVPRRSYQASVLT